MPAWAIASLAAFTMRDSLVSPSSLPNLPWDQPTMQAVMGFSFYRVHIHIIPALRRASPGKPLKQENSSLQPYFRPPQGVDCAVTGRSISSHGRHATASARTTSDSALAPDPGWPAGRFPAGRGRFGPRLVPVLSADRERRGPTPPAACAARPAGSRPGAGQGARGPDRQAKDGQQADRGPDCGAQGPAAPGRLHHEGSARHQGARQGTQPDPDDPGRAEDLI